MSDVKLSALPSGDPIQRTDELLINRSGASKKVTADALLPVVDARIMSFNVRTSLFTVMDVAVFRLTVTIEVRNPASESLGLGTLAITYTGTDGLSAFMTVNPAQFTSGLGNVAGASTSVVVALRASAGVINVTQAATIGDSAPQLDYSLAMVLEKIADL